jgi:hypothetical protein
MRPSISQNDPAELAARLTQAILSTTTKKTFVQQAEAQDCLNFNLPPNK